MKDCQVDVAVIGGGPAGLAAAVSAKEHGARSVIILDRNHWLGGILPQCIHDGFGVEETGSSMTGPEYAELYIGKAEEPGITIMKETMVLEFTEGREILCVNKEGIHRIVAGAIIVATGCREKTRWNAMIPGDRPSGIFTAGVAQAFINLYNLMPGKNVVVLGSGDVGLIMARRFKLEGANVLGVVEIFPYASGLPRNVVQCLQDYDIPLFLEHTVTFIEGRERLEAVTIAWVDENMTPVPGTEKRIECDTLLLSLGLLPENELTGDAGAKIDEKTNGPVVNQDLESSMPGIFACGNCLQVYDTVDILVSDAKRTGRNAAKHVTNRGRIKATGERHLEPTARIAAGEGVRYVVPQMINRHGKIHLTLRSARPMNLPTLTITSNDTEIYRKKIRYANPANMTQVDLTIEDGELAQGQVLEVTLHER